jgi:hypothetical protein
VTYIESPLEEPSLMELLIQSSSVDCQIMSTSWKWTMDPNNFTIVDTSSNFIVQCSLKLVRVYSRIETILPYLLDPESTPSTTINYFSCVPPMNLLDILICSRHEQDSREARGETPRWRHPLPGRKVETGTSMT